MYAKYLRLGLAGSLCASAAGLSAQQADVPYWATISVDEVNMRRGPSTRYPIEWVYQRPGLPVKVLRTNEGWRYIEDPDGTRGWMAARMLSRTRGAIVTGEGEADIRAEADAASPLRWHVEPGVVAELGDCTEGWCAVSVAGHRGFMAADRLWGDGEP